MVFDNHLSEFYPSSVPSGPFWEMSSSKRLVPDPIMGVEMSHCSIREAHGVIQVFQNCFIVIQNPMGGSRLG